ncbi:MAG: ATP-dependent helicase [Pseudomonadales bacterium]|nr:ATP-dependent helicase [Pseudomonadales bacterium]
MQLTQEQQQVIDVGFEHCLITAVAGSGKTTTLAHRIIALLQQRHDPGRMLILMFNRNAKEDFERKLGRLCNEGHFRLPEIRTYHAMGYRLYQRFVREGYLQPVNPQILSEQEIHYQVWNLIRALAPSDLADEIKRNKKEYVERGSQFIDLVKSTLKKPSEVFAALDYSPRFNFLLDLFDRFEQWRQQHARYSFSDMLYEPVKLIHENPELLNLVTNKMDLVLVDEYQDTNEIQHLLLKYIAGDRAKITVVGDPDQTIYEFRGAKPEYILNRFAKEFPNPKQLTLSYTFRYGHRIALLANHLITHNKGRNNVLCRSHPMVSDSSISLHYGADAEQILELVNTLSGQDPSSGSDQSGRRLSDITILCRVWSQSITIELALLANRVPYQISAGKGALHSKEMNAVRCLLEFASGKFRDFPMAVRKKRFETLLRFPHCGLAEDRIQDLSQYLASHDRNWSEHLRERLGPSGGLSLHPLQKRKLGSFADALQQLLLLAQRGNTAAQCLKHYANATELFEGVRSLALTKDIAEERVATITGIFHYLFLLKLGTAESLEHLQDLSERANQNTADDRLLLTTMHRAKGLEWPVVIIPGLNDKFMPYTVRENEITATLLESERRLLYVAMTRAVEQLHLICPARKKSAPDKSPPPSRFLGELEFNLSQELGHYLAQRKTSLPAPPFTPDRPLSTTARRYCALENVTYVSPKSKAEPKSEEPQSPIWQQQYVDHAIFGRGTITREESSSFQVKFDEGRVLDFSKKSAHLYFTAITA